MRDGLAGGASLASASLPVRFGNAAAGALDHGFRKHQGAMRRYIPLLLALFGFLILQPIAVALSGANIPLNILMYVVLASAIYAVGPPKSLVAVATALALAIVTA
jgi:hypothetical protein